MQVCFSSPEGVLFRDEAQEVHVPGFHAGFTILDKHAPLLSPLSHGTIRIVSGGTEKSWQIGSGFIDVQNNEVSIVAEGVSAQ